MGTPHKHAEVLRAIADGKDVQWSKSGGIMWGDYCRDGRGYDPISDPDILWRIKPEPKSDVVRYCFITESFGHSEKELQSGLLGGSKKPNLKIIIDGETGALKAAEVLK